MRRALVPAFVLAMAACRGSGNDQPGAATTTTHAEPHAISVCPLGVPETRVSMSEEPDRVVVDFRTPKARVPDLRARVAYQIGQNGPERREGPGHDGKHGSADGHGLRLWEMPPSRAIIEETPDGAKLHVKPLADGDLPVLVAKMRERIRALEEKDCP